MIRKIDARREAVILDEERLLPFLIDDFYTTLKDCLDKKGQFHVALAGGSTPKKLYTALVQDPRALNTPWERVFIYYGDERAVPLTDPESNYHMSLEAGFKHLKNLKIFPLPAFEWSEAKQKGYEAILPHFLDLIILGMGDDGHTASLFPNDPLLKAHTHKLAYGYIESKKAFRMTMTLDYINRSKKIWLLITGASKAPKIAQVLSQHGAEFPAYHIGTPSHKALFVLDPEAASQLF